MVIWNNKHIFNCSQLAKLKKRVSLSCHCHEIYTTEEVGLQSCNNIFCNHNFCEYLRFGVVSWKFDLQEWMQLNIIVHIVHVNLIGLIDN